MSSTKAGGGEGKSGLPLPRSCVCTALECVRL